MQTVFRELSSAKRKGGGWEDQIVSEGKYTLNGSFRVYHPSNIFERAGLLLH